MGVVRCAQIADALMAGGLAASTPAAAIGAAHTPRQRHVLGSLVDLAALVVEAAIESPAILVIGDVVAGAAGPAAHGCIDGGGSGAQADGAARSPAAHAVAA